MINTSNSLQREYHVTFEICILRFVVACSHACQYTELPTTATLASHGATIFCNHLAKWLQKIVASQKPTHVIITCCYYLCNHLAKLLQKIIASQKTNTSHGATIFCNHLAKLLKKIIASQKTNTSHVATIFCNHLAKLLPMWRTTIARFQAPYLRSSSQHA